MHTNPSSLISYEIFARDVVVDRVIVTSTAVTAVGLDLTQTEIQALDGTPLRTVVHDVTDLDPATQHVVLAADLRAERESYYAGSVSVAALTVGDQR